MPERRSLRLKLESKIDSVDAAELIVQALARDAGFAPDAIDQLGVAVRETMVNAVCHGNAYSRDKSVYFNVEIEAGTLTVTVRDEGEGFDPEDVPDPTAPENLLRTSGRGLLLMRALVDEFTIRRADPKGMEAVLIKRAQSATRETRKDD